MPYYGHLSQRQYIDRMQESKDWFEDDEAEALRRPMTDALGKLLERVLRQDLVVQLMARRYQRTPKRISYRNGFYYRSLLTSAPQTAAVDPWTDQAQSQLAGRHHV